LPGGVQFKKPRSISMPCNGKTLDVSTKSMLQAYQTIAPPAGTLLAQPSHAFIHRRKSLVIDTVAAHAGRKADQNDDGRGVTNSNSASVCLARRRRVFYAQSTNYFSGPQRSAFFSSAVSASTLITWEFSGVISIPSRVADLDAMYPVGTPFSLDITFDPAAPRLNRPPGTLRPLQRDYNSDIPSRKYHDDRYRRLHRRQLSRHRTGLSVRRPPAIRRIHGLSF